MSCIWCNDAYIWYYKEKRNLIFKKLVVGGRLTGTHAPNQILFVIKRINTPPV